MEEEIKRFFAYEYKNPEDANAAMYQHVLKTHTKEKKNFLQIFINKINQIIDSLWYNYDVEYEKYLSKSVSLEDLERRQLIWETMLRNKNSRFV